MAYLHGVYPTEKSETAVSLSTTTQVQVVIGTAPIHMLDNPSEAVNKPILCESKEDCYKKIGYSTDFSKYTLCQSMFASFFKIGVAPVVFINVLDPEKHNKEVTDKEFVVQDNSILIDDAVILSTLKLTAASNTISHEDYVTISTHTLRGERDSTYCICEVTPPQQSGHFTKNHFKNRYFLHNMYYFFSEPPYKTNITARSLTKSNCPQGHMFPLHLYAPLSSSNYYPNNRIEGYLVLHQ